MKKNETMLNSENDDVALQNRILEDSLKTFSIFSRMSECSGEYILALAQAIAYLPASAEACLPTGRADKSGGSKHFRSIDEQNQNSG